MIEIDPATLSQCTGLKDKNGKLIFEGDVLRIIAFKESNHPDGGKTSLVCFGEHRRINDELHFPVGDCGFYLEWLGKEPAYGIANKHILRNDIMYWVGGGYVEIIGNVHDDKLEDFTP